MILQLSNGRIIELSLEQYLELTEDELQELNCLGLGYTKDFSSPFHNLYSSNERIEEEIEEEPEDFLFDDEDDEIPGMHYFPNDEIF